MAGFPVGPAHPGEPKLWQQVFTDYFFWAERYNWPPDVVDRQPAVVLHRLREVIGVVEEWRADQAERDG